MVHQWDHTVLCNRARLEARAKGEGLGLTATWGLRQDVHLGGPWLLLRVLAPISKTSSSSDCALNMSVIYSLLCLFVYLFEEIDLGV